MSPSVYHTGSLAIDRQRDKAVGDRARSLLRQAEAGEVELTPRRAGSAIAREATRVGSNPISE
jgi:hypothetical protein